MAEEKEKNNRYPDELTDENLEYIYIGLLLNNPKAISMYYFLLEDCQFSDEELFDIYKSILFQEAEKYAPAIAKNGFNIPREKSNTYARKQEIKRIVGEKNYNIEFIYTELKKLFIMKKYYIVAATKKIRDKILEIQHYKLYAEMTVEEVQNAIDQIGVTAGLSEVVLNYDATNCLLAGDNTLKNGAEIPFPILSKVFKGLRRGETMSYAMPSNSGKSRFTVNLAAYLAFIEKKKVLIISNEMSEEKMRLCLITTIINNKEIQKLHKQKLIKSEGELLELKFRPDDPKKSKVDKDGFMIKEDGETDETFYDRLYEDSTEFQKVIAATDWLGDQVNNSIYFIHVTEHTNDDLRKIIMNYYYKEQVEYVFYDTLKTDIDNIGNGDEVKKTATVLSNLAQKFKMFIGSSLQLQESSTLPVNLTINDMSASRTVKEVLDTLCLMKQISYQSLKKYEYSSTDTFDECHDIEPSKDVDVRFYACVVDKNRAGAKPTVLFRLNLAYNSWEELGYLRLKQVEEE
jgi:replicative DNA helicase